MTPIFLIKTLKTLGMIAGLNLILFGALSLHGLVMAVSVVAPPGDISFTYPQWLQLVELPLLMFIITMTFRFKILADADRLRIETKLDNQLDTMAVRFSAKIDTLETKYDLQCDNSESRLDAKINSVGDRLSAELKANRFAADTQDTLLRADMNALRLDTVSNFVQVKHLNDLENRLNLIHDKYERRLDDFGSRVFKLATVDRTEKEGRSE